MPIQIKTSGFNRLERFLSDYSRQIEKKVMPEVVKAATAELKAAVSVRSGRLKKSIEGKQTGPISGVVKARFYVRPHLSRKFKTRGAANKIVFRGALKGARKALNIKR